MSQKYDTLEKQIGDMGGDIDTVNPGTDGLGKLKHKEVYTGKRDLGESEQRSLDDFMARSRDKERAESNVGRVEIADGWIPVDREEMGVRSLFYPAEWEFFVKPATLQAIKNWTSIDEERPEQVNRVFNEIIKLCVKIDTHSSQGAGWSQINSWDRFWFTLKVREYTFSKGESKVEFEDSCSECGSDIKFTLTSDSLYYEFPDDDLIEKYWTGTEWYIDPTEYGVAHEPITLYTPKLGKDEAIIDWATAKARANQKLDETFIKFAIWMLNKPSRDPQNLDRQVQKLYNEYKSWDEDMFMFMDDVINNITINPSEKLRMKCPHCGGEAIANVQFPNGIKTLFTRENTGRKKFGSR